MFLKFLGAHYTRAGAIRTLESLARIEEGAQGGWLPCPPGSLLTGFFPIPGVPGRPHPPTSHRLVQTAKIRFCSFCSFCRPVRARGAVRVPTLLTPELREALCAHLAQGAHVKTACEAVGISEPTYYAWQARGKKARDEPPPTLELTRQGLIDLLAEADVPHPAAATKTVLLRLLTLHRQEPFLEFLEAVKRAGAIRTLESLARIELGAQGGALLERVTTTRTAKDGTEITTVRERYTPPDWHADGWFPPRRRSPMS